MRNKINIIIAVVFAVAFSSCDKELDLVPLDQLSPGTFWQGGSDWESWVNRYYPGIGNHGNGALDINSDLTFGQGTNATSAGNFLPPQTSGFYDGSYGTIRQLNIAIDQFDLAEPEIQAEAERYVAEARFFRAWTYYNLLKAYGGVILIDRTLDLDSEELFAPRASRLQTADFIMADLDWAETRLPSEAQLSDGEIGRITSGAVSAFKARVGLFEGTWQKYHAGGGESNRFFDVAISEAEKVISSGNYELFNDFGADSYYFLFLDEGEGNSETVLGRRYDQGVSDTHNTSRWVDTQIAAPTRSLADLYVCTDGLPIDVSPLFQGRALITSEFENRDWRMLGTIMKPGTIRNVDGLDVEQRPTIGTSGNGASSTGYQSRKFLANGLTATSGQQTYDFMAIRYAEVLLVLAEAMYERNGSITDADLDRSINLLRSRGGVAALSNALVNDNNLDMLTEIRRERTIELAYEGFRYDDLRRWATAEDILPNALLGVQFEGTAFETEYPEIVPGEQINVDNDGFIISDPESFRQFEAPKHYLQPLPLEELQLNDQLDQNPGW